MTEFNFVKHERSRGCNQSYMGIRVGDNIQITGIMMEKLNASYATMLYDKGNNLIAIKISNEQGMDSYKISKTNHYSIQIGAKLDMPHGRYLLIEQNGDTFIFKKERE